MSKENDLNGQNNHHDAVEMEEDDNQSDLSNDESLAESSAEAGASPSSSNRNQSAEPPSKNNSTPTNTKKSRTKSSASGPGSSSKPRLTPIQKNTNHKDAENKRRNAIRERFTDLSRMVPGAEGQERSEQVMLSKTTEFLRAMLEEQRKLERLAASRGVVIDESQKLKESDFGGRAWRQGNMIAYEKGKLKKDI